MASMNWDFVNLDYRLSSIQDKAVIWTNTELFLFGHPGLYNGMIAFIMNRVSTNNMDPQKVTEKCRPFIRHEYVQVVLKRI